jgi:CBS domain-containing protein
MQDIDPVVSDVMATPPVVVRSHDSLWRAMDRFLATGLRHLVVLDEEDAVLGILDDRAVAAEWVGDALRLHRVTIGELLLASPARPASIHRDTPLRDAARSMVRQGADALPVIGDDGRVAGIVTASALLGGIVQVEELVRSDPARSAAPAGTAR